MQDAISNAIGAHGSWKFKLSTAARTMDSSIDVAKTSADDQCEFGKWLKQVKPRMAGDSNFANIQRMHAEFHRNAGAVAALIRDGNQKGAQAALAADGAFARQSESLSMAMSAWKIALRNG